MHEYHAERQCLDIRKMREYHAEKFDSFGIKTFCSGKPPTTIGTEELNLQLDFTLR